MANAAVLGYGVVGSGVVCALTGNVDLIEKRAGEKIEVKRILDLREFPDSPFAARFTKNFDDILNDNDICVVAEAMGGIEPAYTFTKRLLSKGKSVVTSNKELVAAHGAELIELARANEANYLFEGAVCGGIPLIRTVYGAVTTDKILRVAGIMNGTTNYILTQMRLGGSYEAALKEAQELGYAERDPGDDVMAKDPCRKLAILLSLCTGKTVDWNGIYTEGITHLTSEDVLYAKALDGAIKLVAYAETGDSIKARVAPAIVCNEHPLYNVNGVFNAVCLDCDVTGEIMLYGRGAGHKPTGGAVAADVVEAVKAKGKFMGCYWSHEKQPVLSKDEMAVKKLVRVEYADKLKTSDLVNQYFKIERFVEIGKAGEMGFVAGLMSEGDLSTGVAALEKGGVKVLSQIYVI
jgi:homoserine dehydrogenase